MPSNTDYSGSGRAAYVRRSAVIRGPSTVNLRVGSMANIVPISGDCCSTQNDTSMIIAINIPNPGGMIRFEINNGQNNQTVIINWGDGTIETYVSSITGPPITPTHVYSSSGIFKISLSGSVIQFRTISGAEYITAVDQWNPDTFYLGSAFVGAVNLVSLPTYTQYIVDMTNMLRDATSFNQDLSSWDLTPILQANSIFCNCPLLNQPAKYPRFPTTFPPAGDSYYGC